jgi:hypothetical protein
MVRSVIAGLVFVFLSVNGFAAEFSINDETNGAGSILLLGEIKNGDEVKFKEEVKLLTQQGKWLDRVYLYSGGGALPAAMNIGDQIYLLRASTFAPIDWRNAGQPRHFMCQGIGGVNIQYYPESHVGDARCMCASACFFIWAAGRGRNGNALGVHRIKFDPEMFGKLPTSEAETLYNQAMERAKAYLHKMGIPLSIADLSFSVGSNDIRYLTPQEYGPLVGIGTPYLEELVNARCGSYTSQIRDSDGLRLNWWNCYFKTREEEVRAGTADWRKAFP